METRTVYGADWQRARTLLPMEVEDLARQTNALSRRRQISSGEMLLRVLLAYSGSGWTFEKTVAWLRSQGWASMTPAALFFRLRNSTEFLSRTLALMLESEHGPKLSGFRLKIVDASSLSEPGSKGTDYRVHVLYNPQTGHPASVEVSDASAGESFSRYAFQAGDLILADRGYSRAPGIHHLLSQHAHTLVRLHPNGIRLLHTDESYIDWTLQAALVPEVGAFSFWARMPVPPEGARNNWRTSSSIAWHDVRIIGARNNKGEVVWLLTDLGADHLSEDCALNLYRQRWQIELFFKRLKSLVDLNELPSRDPTTAIPWIMLKLICALLAMKLTSEVFSPWGYLPKPVDEPLEAGQRRNVRATTGSRREGLSGPLTSTLTSPKRKEAPTPVLTLEA